MVGFTNRINGLLDHLVLPCAVEILHPFWNGGSTFLVKREIFVNEKIGWFLFFKEWSEFENV